ncbi:MAG: hypothetical protein IKB99_09635 [Lentisphaeria bacterium]|nr:hypothetical protein [Lentisphaeria bacterium]
MKKSMYVLLLSVGLGTAANGALPTVFSQDTLLQAEINVSSNETAPLLIAHRPHRHPAPRPVVVVPPRPVVVVPPRPVPPPRPVVVVPPRPVVVVPPRPVPPPRPVVVIPDYGYGWWNNTYVPCYNDWYWYNGVWVWGGRGPRPVPPRWVPDFRLRPMPPPPPRHGVHHPAPRRPVPVHHRGPGYRR